MKQTQNLEIAVLRCAAPLLAVFAVIFLLALSPDAWRLSVAYGVLGCVASILGLRRATEGLDSLVLWGSIFIAVMATVLAMASHF